VQVAGAYCQYALFCLLVQLFKIQQTRAYFDALRSLGIHRELRSRPPRAKETRKISIPEPRAQRMLYIVNPNLG
jgi:hypothetical protein